MYSNYNIIHYHVYAWLLLATNTLLQIQTIEGLRIIVGNPQFYNLPTWTGKNIFNNSCKIIHTQFGVTPPGLQPFNLSCNFICHKLHNKFANTSDKSFTWCTLWWHSCHSTHVALQEWRITYIQIFLAMHHRCI